MQDFEKPGVFYLGREYDLETNTLGTAPLLYNSRDLSTHAVCLGMTGSGKTGLCISLLEEAAINAIPAIVVDPKGDLPNLLLTFPQLRERDFLPWINEDDAQRKGVTPAEYAAAQAALWKKGLADWGQNEERIRKLKDSAEFAVYTPGSTAGIPVSILKSFAFPGKAVVEDTELFGERTGTTATSLLSLLGVDADPIRSREHILLATILDNAWKQGRDLDLAGFIHLIQKPPVSRVGVLDLESFFPSTKRFELAMKLNNLLAAPGFSAWIEGEPPDINRMLYTATGKPRISIFSIAHLNDPERMFFVTLLLTQLLGWMRSQPGTSSLRALFYMDEIFGYFPPVANPPSKAPLLALLKQARAFGLGIVLATQNPVDLDYKGLSNAGSWFLGRLQTDRDKERVLDGLEGVSSGGSGRFNRKKMEKALSALGQRVFLMNNVHEDAPVVFQTRWTMSYLRGPMTRAQIKLLMDPVKTADPASAPPVAATPASPAPTQHIAQAAPAPVPSSTSPRAASASANPVLPPAVPQVFLPVRVPRPENSALSYEPMLLGAATVHYSDAKTGISAKKDVCLLAGFSANTDWNDARGIEAKAEEFEKSPRLPDASFATPPPEASSAKNYPAWGTSFREWIYRNRALALLKSPGTGLVSRPQETEAEFRIRLQHAVREKQDAQTNRLHRKYAPKIAALEERLRRAGQTLEKEKAQAGQQKLQTVISFGATILSVLTGRKPLSQSTLGRGTTTARGAGRTLKETQDVARAQANIQALQQQLEEIRAQMEQEAGTAIDPVSEELETCEIRPKKTEISVSIVALAWFPYWRDDKGACIPAL